MEEKIFKVNFFGFFPSFDVNHNFIIDEIKKLGKVEISDKPDYIFYSVFNDDYLLYPDAVRIFFTGENIAPNFQLCDYAIGFERLDFGDRYLRFPFYYGMYEYKDDVKLTEGKHQNIEDELFERDFCSFVYSNSDTDSVRNHLFDALSRYKRVDAGGKLKNNLFNGPVRDKRLFENAHKFSIACENSSHPGYATEKLIQSFAAKTIPIYYGDPTIACDFNAGAFINCHDYKTLDEVVKVVREIDQDKERYLNILKQPAFNSTKNADTYRKSFELFIRNIFLQDYSCAFRRNRVFWGKKIDNKYIKIYKLERVLKKIKYFVKCR